MKRIIGITLVFLGFGVSIVEARMYQWINPQTGSTQLSGSPPAWYRSGLPGPRVLVFENGVLIDDTAVPVNFEQENRLRERATSEEEARELAELRRIEAVNRERAEARAARDAAREDVAVSAETEPSAGPEVVEPEVVEEVEEALTPDLISRMKALIQQFDRDQGARSR
ncbi:MAG: hypothetical protein AAF493_21490 [Pseudomonadota bacterium]